MIPHWQADDLDIRLYHGDCRHVLACLAIMAPESISCCITSPPYYGLRDYGLEPVVWADAWRGCLGLEPTPNLYVAHLTEVFAQVRRVLHPLGTLWLNLGDSYSGSGGGNYSKSAKQTGHGQHLTDVRNKTAFLEESGTKPKDLLGIPWLAAFALRAAGWHLRSDIIWAKTNPMPESVYDRPTKSHEYVFLLSKQQRYYYDAEAIREPYVIGNGGRQRAALRGTFDYAERDYKTRDAVLNRHDVGKQQTGLERSAYGTGRNLRSVWQFATQPYPGAHFATFPEELARRCVLAGCPPGGIVLDPFCGTGTTGAVCVALERRFVGIDASATYLDDHAAVRIGAALVARGYT